MNDKEFLNKLALKLMGRAARIKDLEQEVLQLKVALTKNQEKAKKILT